MARPASAAIAPAFCAVALFLAGDARAALTASELAQFIRGDGEFGRRFAPSTGLGPIFNDVSCAACHSGDGRGRPSNALTRIGSPDNDMYRSLGGPQIQDRAIPGALAESPSWTDAPRRGGGFTPA